VASYRPPALGENTEELLEELGYSAEDRSDLLRRGIVNAPDPVKA
jgi:crotonobetainyl-CoA:carnitine CoA-transferase CaiB-like acyl-CoA transferase